MTQPTQSENRLIQPLRFALRREGTWAEGRRRAFEFANENQYATAPICAAIQWYEEIFVDPSATQQGQPFAPNTSVRLLAEGYLKGLKDVLNMILRGISINMIQEEEKTAEGRRDAFDFTLQIQGDELVLKAEIARHEAASANASNAHERARAAGYLAGLNDALKIIQGAQTNGSAPET